MQPNTPHPLPIVSSSSSSTRIFASLAIVGLSAVTMFGAFKLKTVWKHVQGGRTEESNVQKNAEELKTLRRALEKSRADVEEKKTMLLSYLNEIESLRNRVLEAEGHLDGVKEENRTLTDRSTTLEVANKQLKAELQHAKTERQQAKELLDLRTAELKGAQAYLTKADQLSNAEVTKLVENLNAEIMQTAATMAEELAIEEKKIDVDAKEQESDEMREAYARTEEIIGPRMAEMLKMSEHHEDPILIQIAVQASVAAYTHWIISSWAFESPEDEHMLSEIYARVREAEEQAISGRWRQLTRAHLQRMLAHNPELALDLINAICNIVVTAGMKDSLQNVQDRITSRFGDRISVVVKMAQGLNKRIGEGVTSSDLEALYIGPDAIYNSTTMEDALGPVPNNEGAKAPEQILCTTDLGLVRAEKIAGSLGDWKESVLLKPKVVLFSGIAGVVGNFDSSL